MQPGNNPEVVKSRHGRDIAVPACIAALTCMGAAILGYHPYAEDGGIYLAEIKRALDPGMYPAFPEFVSGHLGRVPGFADAVAWLVRISGVRLDWLMLATHLLCLLVVLFSVWRLAARSFATPAGRWGAVAMVACCGGMPVAGTSLMLIDPYVTARSVALALTILGMAEVVEFALDRTPRSLAFALLAFAIAILAHPLMGSYGTGEAVVLACLLCWRRGIRLGGVLAAAGCALVIAALVQRSAPAETAEYWRVAATRYYWFLSQWQWYELFGAFAPLVILGWMGRRSVGIKRYLASMAVCVGIIALVIASIFARQDAAVHAVARVQPLRCLQMVYLILLIMLGGWLGETLLRRAAPRWIVAALALGGLMFFVQRQTYPSSAHLELPGLPVSNAWESAFVWVRGNTPREALFALDADYVHRGGEDAQVFRAIAERSALPDYSKDGGQAAIRPGLTPLWTVGQAAQKNLTGETDEDRLLRLAPLGVTWLVMGREARTGFVCPYRNESVIVCRLGR